MRAISAVILFVLVLIHFGNTYLNKDNVSRVKRGYRRDYNHGKYDRSRGYDQDSDERDVSISGEVACSDEGDRSDSREAFGFRDGRRYPTDRIRGSRSFSKSSASASASAFQKKLFS